MPVWKYKLPADEISDTYRLVRTPTVGSLVATVTSEGLLSCPVHFYGGRTVPHEVEGECVPCQAHRSYRWVAFLSCINDKNGEHILFETTVTAAQPFEKHQAQFGTLRGCRFRSTRPSGRVNGRMFIVIQAANAASMAVPEAPDVAAVLEHMWKSTLDIALPPDGRKESLKIVATNGRDTAIDTPGPIEDDTPTQPLTREEIQRRLA